jgi:hypothetical protein
LLHSMGVTKIRKNSRTQICAPHSDSMEVRDGTLFFRNAGFLALAVSL